MQPSPLLLDGILATATAALYAYVGALTLRRETSDADARRAVRLFGVWWFSLAAITVIGTLRTLLVVADATQPALHQAISWLTIVPLVAALWGLVSYLLYIYTGDARAFTLSTIFHAGLLAALVYIVAERPVTSVALGDYGVRLEYSSELGAAVTAVLSGAILLPVLGAAIGYATLYFRTKDRSARYRIAMVSGAFIFWFGSVGAASALKLNAIAWWPVASRVIALIATLMVLAAYLPPRWAQNAYGIRSARSRADEEKERRFRLARSMQVHLSDAA